MEIYYDILIGIERESKANGLVKRTRVQQYSGLSYDKFSRHLSDMTMRRLVSLNPMSITEKGREFAREYNRVRSFMLKIGAKFFESTAPARRITQELVSGIPKMSHSVLFYEDRKYADLVAAEYLSRGLEKAESCVYLTSEDPELVKKRLTDLVGPLREGIRENRLRIYPVHAQNIDKAPSFNAIKKLLEDSTRGMKPRFGSSEISAHLSPTRRHGSQNSQSRSCSMRVSTRLESRCCAGTIWRRHIELPAVNSSNQPWSGTTMLSLHQIPPKHSGWILPY